MDDVRRLEDRENRRNERPAQMRALLARIVAFWDTPAEGGPNFHDFTAILREARALLGKATP